MYAFDPKRLAFDIATRLQPDQVTDFLRQIFDISSPEIQWIILDWIAETYCPNFMELE